MRGACSRIIRPVPGLLSSWLEGSALERLRAMVLRGAVRTTGLKPDVYNLAIYVTEWDATY